MSKEEISIAVIKTQVDAMFKKQDELLDLMKDGFSSIKESYTRQVSRLEVDMARTRNEQRETNNNCDDAIESLCKRIQKLERRQDVVIVKITFIATLLAVVAGRLLDLFI